MTSRERVLAALRGEGTDRAPILDWREGDFAIGEDAWNADETRMRLWPVSNPFGLARHEGLDLNARLKASPEAGAADLDRLVDAVRAGIREGLRRGADGVLYALFGACEADCTPMQYGGHYLERDRELLSDLQDAACNVLFVAGDAGLYLDFVSDLPAHAMVWDRSGAETSLQAVRAMRPGALGTQDPEADFVLPRPLSSGLPAILFSAAPAGGPQ